MESNDWRQIKEIFNAVLDAPALERAELLKDCDVEVCREVEKLIKANESAGEFISQTAFFAAGFDEEDETDFYISKQIDSYLILEEIGHGGMGTVYLAERSDDFEKRVALKLIKRGMDTNSVLRRFFTERQILARLEHPNIANLLDGGSTKDGLPYFVMEFVEGLPITKFCHLHGFSIDERLELFQKVCSAISYAHQNLIVHRDIKPSNILVTEDGTPKLLDFGIAKFLHPDWSLDTNEATATMFRLMTPEYASPEQVSGFPITTASDVYSLGVVLYELLTGERPYKIESRMPQEAANIILMQEPNRPSSAVSGQWSVVGKTQKAAFHQTNPKANSLNLKSLRGDLDNIILKALRKEPERRYQTVREFCEDIRRHLVGLPVTATTDTDFYRFKKFIKRHRAGVFASGLIFLILLTATAITSWQAVVARREQAKAEKRFNELRHLSNSLLTETYDSLTNIPGTEETQRILTQKSLGLLESLSKDETSDIKLLGELALAYIKIGQLQTDTLGNSESALKSYRKAVEIQRRRLLLVPNDVELKTDLVFGLFKVSEIVSGLGEYEEFIKAADEIIRLQHEILAAQKDNPELSKNLAGSYEYRGGFLKAWNHPNEARADFEKAIELINQSINHAKDKPSSPDEKISLSFTYMLQGEMFENLQEWQKAAESYRTAGEIAEAVYRQNPSMIQAIRNTISSHGHLGNIWAKLGKHKEALENYQYALELIKDVRKNNQNDANLTYAEAVYQVRTAIGLEKVGAKNEGLETMDIGLSLIRKNISENANRKSAVYYNSELLRQIADFYMVVKQSAKSLEILHEVRRSIEKTALESPSNLTLNENLADIYGKTGDIYFEKNNIPESRRWFGKSLGIWKKLSQSGQYTDVRKIEKLRQMAAKYKTTFAKYSKK